MAAALRTTGIAHGARDGLVRARGDPGPWRTGVSASAAGAVTFAARGRTVGRAPHPRRAGQENCRGTGAHYLGHAVPLAFAGARLALRIPRRPSSSLPAARARRSTASGAAGACQPRASLRDAAPTAARASSCAAGGVCKPAQVCQPDGEACSLTTDCCALDCAAGFCGGFAVHARRLRLQLADRVLRRAGLHRRLLRRHVVHARRRRLHGAAATAAPASARPTASAAARRASPRAPPACRAGDCCDLPCTGGFCGSVCQPDGFLCQTAAPVLLRRLHRRASAARSPASPRAPGAVPRPTAAPTSARPASARSRQCSPDGTGCTSRGRVLLAASAPAASAAAACAVRRLPCAGACVLLQAVHGQPVRLLPGGLCGSARLLQRDCSPAPAGRLGLGSPCMDSRQCCSSVCDPSAAAPAPSASGRLPLQRATPTAAAASATRRWASAGDAAAPGRLRLHLERASAAAASATPDAACGFAAARRTATRARRRSECCTGFCDPRPPPAASSSARRTGSAARQPASSAAPAFAERRVRHEPVQARRLPLHGRGRVLQRGCQNGLCGDVICLPRARTATDPAQCCVGLTCASGLCGAPLPDSGSCTLDPGGTPCSQCIVGHCCTQTRPASTTLSARCAMACFQSARRRHVRPPVPADVLHRLDGCTSAGRAAWPRATAPSASEDDGGSAMVESRPRDAPPRRPPPARLDRRPRATSALLREIPIDETWERAVQRAADARRRWCTSSATSRSSTSSPSTTSPAASACPASASPTSSGGWLGPERAAAGSPPRAAPRDGRRPGRSAMLFMKRRPACSIARGRAAPRAQRGRRPAPRAARAAARGRARDHPGAADAGLDVSGPSGSASRIVDTVFGSADFPGELRAARAAPPQLQERGHPRRRAG